MLNSKTSILFLVLFFLLFNNSFAQYQHACGNNPRLLQNNIGNNNLRKKAIKIVQADNTTIYTIPVIFHVYHLGEDVGVGSNVSDAAINASINRLNDVFRAKGIHTGLTPDVKIQFELAKFTDNCTATNGIIRIDGRNIPTYAEGPVTFENNAMHQTLYNASPMSNGYVNIRILHNTNNYGWAYFGGDMFMFASSVNTSTTSYGWDSFWAHEMGHALNLDHTFAGSEGGQCPPNANPAEDGDGVADTEPHKDEDWDCSSSLNNACTNAAYQNSVLKNHMSYFNCTNLFTPLQVVKMRNSLLSYRPVFNINNNMFTKESGSWNDATIWSCGRVPNATDEVTISPYTYVYIPANANVTIKKLFKQGDFELEAGSKLTLKPN